MSKNIAILILFFNKLQQTIECVESFLESNQNIYILNNGSDLKQWNNLKSFFKDSKSITFIDAGKNIGVSAGRNKLISYTKEPWIFCVDNDITISCSSSWIQKFENFINNRENIEIVCPLLFNKHDNTFSEKLSIKLYDKIVKLETGNFSISNCFPGGASIVRRSVYETYGMYDEEMFVGFEDYEFAIRAIVSLNKPLSVFHCDDITLIHDHRYQKTKNDKDAVRQRYNDEKLKKSYDRMVKKYEIFFEHDWKWWTQKQITEMTTRRGLSNFKNYLKKIFR